MRLGIRHETRYRYHNPVELLDHRLLMTPRSDHQLTVICSSLICQPAATMNWSQDVFGNRVATAIFGRPVTDLTILAEMEVEQSAPAWPVLLIDPAFHHYPFSYTSDDALDLAGLARPEPASGRFASWVEAFVARPTTDTLSLLKDLNEGILASVAYRIRDEEGTQSPNETLALASGSCRDIAALFIEAVRYLGFGARAVSGYLFDPTASLADSGSTHAWAEVYLPGAGWIAFDPTHRRMGAAMLVAAAVGRSNRQIMPVTGGYLGAPGDACSMEVNVEVRRLHS
jgi:transglutaminase-like putative cysteine protease